MININIFVIYGLVGICILLCCSFFRDLLISIYYLFRYKRKRLEVFGLYCFCGYFGSGKTLSLSHYLIDLKKQCEKAGKNCFIYTNYHLKGGEVIESLDDFYNICMKKMNEEDGFKADDVLLFGFDELQNLFNSRQYNSFPMEFLSILTQMRKLNILVCFTSPLTGLADKNLRDLSNKFIVCKKINRFYFVNYHFNQDDYQLGKMSKIIWDAHWLINPNEELYNTHEFVKSLKNLDYDKPNVRENSPSTIKVEGLESFKGIERRK